MTEQLATFDVPRVSVDFLSDDLTGREKLTVLKYLSLDDAVAQIGRQRFGATTVDNIPLKPVRDWVTENWDKEFMYDLRERNIPITFRTSLALALFTTGITEHLTQMGEVEVYGSGAVQQAMKKHDLVAEPGLSTINYAQLPPEAKSDLVMPIIGNLHDAEVVARAGYIFPKGISRQTAFFLNPGLMFMMLGTGNPEEMITFDQINELDTQAVAARAGLSDIQQAKTFEAMGKQVKEKPQPTEEELAAFRESLDKEQEEIPNIHYDPGTRFLDVFPYEEGETPEDLVRAYKRIVKKGYYHGRVDQPHRGEYLEMHLDDEGYLVGFYGFDEGWWGERERNKYDLLSERIFEDDWMDGEFRSKNIISLVTNLRDELDMNKRAVSEAQTTYGQTSFTVEQGFLEALTARSYPKATEAQLDEDKRLAYEARRTARVEEPEQEDVDTKLAVISNQPVDKRTVELDYAILRAIKEHYSLSPSEMLGMMFRSRVTHMDNIGDWFSSCAGLLSTFQSVLVDTTSLFASLGIEPTNDINTIRRAYRAIARQNHPDVISNLSPEEQVQAVDKFKDSTAAYHDLGQRVGHINVDSLAPTYYLGRISQIFNRDPNILVDQS